MADRSEQEHFGEADLGEAQGENPPPDPEMLEDTEAGAAGPELTDVPAQRPAQDPDVVEAEQEAAEQAGEIGGRSPSEGVDPAFRPVSESGGGVAEGFELAEQQHEESASHGDTAGHPLGDRFDPEETVQGSTAFGDADDVRSTERTDPTEIPEPPDRGEGDDESE